MSNLIGYKCRYKKEEWLITSVNGKTITIVHEKEIERVKLTDVTILLDSKK